MIRLLKAKADEIAAWCHRQPPKVNVLCVVLALALFVSPLGIVMNLLIGPGQVGDAVIVWFVWQNVTALVRRREVVTMPAIVKEEADAR